MFPVKIGFEELKKSKKNVIKIFFGQEILVVSMPRMS